MIRKITNRLRSYLRNSALFAGHLLRGGVPSGERPQAHFDVSDPRLERYFYCLVKFFDIAGYRVSLRFRPGLLLNLRNYADLLYNIEGLKIAFTAPKGSEILLTDRKELIGQANTVFINPDYLNPSKAESGFAFPYSMHPLVYERGIDESIGELRKGRRPLRIFFYFANLENYEKNDMRDLFGKLNRKEVGETVLAMLGAAPIEVISTSEELDKIDAGETSFAVVDNVRIQFEDWLPTLAKADFFIAAPGVLMPYCHNLIEAMAVGTIPITEYPEMWSPPLTDGVNCIAYSGSSGLQEKIREVLAMDDERISEMRRAVFEYYDKWFEPRAAVARLMERLDSTDRIYLLAGHLSVSAYKSSRSGTS